jgi:ClpP class serine protease
MDINPLLIQEIFNQPWCINNTYAQGLLMAAASKYFGTPAINGQAAINTGFEAVYAMVPQSATKQSSKFSPGSVGIVAINGPIVQNSDERNGIKGTLQAADEFLMLDADPNIIAHLFYNNSGGGAVYAIKPLDDVIAGLTKPVVTFSKEILGSAAYRLAARTKHIMMYHPQGIVGSIGTMASYSDLQPMFEKWGMNFQEFYATMSTLKNKTYSDAKKGKGKALIANVLDPMNTGMLAEIDSFRGDKLDKTDKTIYQGETYLASKGLDLGLIDSLGTFNDALSYAAVLGRAQNKPRTISTLNSVNMKFPKVFSLAGVATPTAAQLDQANAELGEAGITGLVLMPESIVDEAATTTASLTAAQSELATAKLEVTRLTSDLSTANGSVSTLTTENAGLKAKIAKAPAAAAPVVGVEGDKPTEQTAAQIAQAKVMAMPHNAAALSNPLFAKTK